MEILHANDCTILEELESIAEISLNNHIKNKETREWHPSEIVPFEKADNIPELDSATMSAIYINGLTEDNLAHYTSTLKRLFGKEGAWGEWNNRWTWEESLHGRGIERYIEHIAVFDNQWIESSRKAQITSGKVPEPVNISEISIYTSIQEELTRIAHSRLSQRLSGVGRKLFALIAGDELRHHHFYNSIATGVRERFPDEFVDSMYNITKRFDMPGVGIPGYKEHSEDIERAGIFTSQDVARTIGNIATKYWDLNKLASDVKQDSSKKIVEKLYRRFEVYRRIANTAIDNSRNKETIIKWQNGVPIYNV